MAERRFRRVAVLMGGPSAEREVSLRSGAAVADGLRQAGYAVTEQDVAGRSFALPCGTEAVFVALHGAFGEDGELQALLDRQGMPYTGSGPEASRAAFDKTVSKQAFARHGIPTPPYEVVANGSGPRLELPLVLKPARQGSSIGITQVRRPAEWAGAVAEALRFDSTAIAETFLPGRELTVGIVDGEALPVVEIVAPERWYDYRAKYTAGACRYLVPAPVDAALDANCRSLALKTFRALGCRGLARVDIRCDGQGQPWVLELNSIPGFTATSLLPKAAAEAGIGFGELCARIMDTASTSQGR